MNGTSAVTLSLSTTAYLLRTYLADLEDKDLLVRPVPGANHIAWQLGHTLEVERQMVLEQLPDAAFPELPAGFAEAHSSKSAGSDQASRFHSKDQYLALFDAVRAATIAAVSKLSDADLDRPTKGAFAPFAPTLGEFFITLANHTLMHGGQFTVVRRVLGKPLVM